MPARLGNIALNLQNCHFCIESMVTTEHKRATVSEREPNRHNNFGFLRLLFATLVIISHSAEIIDGNRSREPLVSLFGKLTFGELAVDGFFLISGYLIAKSYETSKTTLSYLSKRVRRIYPGYLVAYFVSLFVLGPFVGVAFSAMNFKDLAKLFLDAFFLFGIRPPGFIGLPYPSLNGSMWTIIIEFRCYLFVILFGAIGLYRSKWLLVFLTLGLLAAMEVQLHPRPPGPLHWMTGQDAYNLFRFLGIFCAGSLFYLYRNSIPYNGKFALVAALALLIFLSQSIVAESAFAILGGYLIFWTALHFDSSFLRGINSREDISYGVYLYAWPVQSALVYFCHISSPWVLTLLTIPIVCAIGFASWRLVERRFLIFKRPTISQATAES